MSERLAGLAWTVAAAVACFAIGYWSHACGR